LALLSINEKVIENLFCVLTKLPGGEHLDPPIMFFGNM